MSSQEDTTNEFKKLVFLPVTEPSNSEEVFFKLPGLRQLVREYYNLVTQEELSEADAERISEIFELAQYDEMLDEWIKKIDEAVGVTECLYVGDRDEDQKAAIAASIQFMWAVDWRNNAKTF
jgi:phosphoglycolate phosphatase-like HAD superfamily hydrolase